jgi:sugar/nucleoside kinase (ribokinase family)
VPVHPAANSHGPAERILRLPGGEVATALIACARLGCRTSYLGTIGNDEAGAIAEAALRQADVDLTHLRRADAPNRFAIILVDHAGHRTVIWHRDPAIGLTPSTIAAAPIAAGRVLVLDASDPLAAAAANHAREAGTPSVLDIDAVKPTVECLLKTVDIVIASAPFFAAYAPGMPVGKALRKVSAEFRPAVVIATLGEEGSLAFAQGEEILTPAFEVPVVDSTGAGDAFRGGFAASWLRLGPDASLAAVIRFASAIAGLNCRAVGAQDGLPTWAEVDRLVTEQGYGRSK